MLFYRAALPLSSRTLNFVAGVIRRHRRSIGSRWRKLSPGRQALLVMVYLKKGETYPDLAAGFGVGTATAWRWTCSRPGPRSCARRSGTRKGQVTPMSLSTGRSSRSTGLPAISRSTRESTRPSMHCSSAKPNQVGKGSLSQDISMRQGADIADVASFARSDRSHRARVVRANERQASAGAGATLPGAGVPRQSSRAWRRR